MNQTAAVIYSRSIANNNLLKNCGAGLIQQHFISLLQRMGYTVHFAGLEDYAYPNEIINADIIVSACMGTNKLPDIIRGRIYVTANNTHYRVKNKRMEESAQKWNLPVEETSDPVIFQRAYDLADYILIGENDAGIKNFISNGISGKKIKYWPNAVDSNIWLPGNKKFDKFTFVGYAASQGLRKGFPALFYAWQKWYKGQNAQLILLGIETFATNKFIGSANNCEVAPGIFAY
jgi:hypothetical protein